MAEFRHPLVDTIVSRLSEPPRWLITIFGPRQAGKTTAVRQALSSIEQKYRYEAVDQPEPPAALTPPTNINYQSTQRDARWLVEVWDHSRRQAWDSPQGFVLVLDEIQKIERWSEVVKGLWDADRISGCPMHVVILGSSPIFMQASLSESMAGRFEPVPVAHWSYSEMAEAFGVSLNQYIYFGGYPGAASFSHDQERWKAYIRSALIEPTIERDVLSMARVNKPALLKKLFHIGALYSGQIVSFNKILGQLQDAGNTTTLARYLDLLSQVGLLTGLPKHTTRPFLAKASIPKLNVLNTALMSATSEYSFEQAQADRSFWGRLVESAVGAHLVNSGSSTVSVKYWRERHDEVDFVLKKGPLTIGVEVKSGRESSAPGLLEFERRFSPQKILVVGDNGVPLHEFLSVPAYYWFETT